MRQIMIFYAGFHVDNWKSYNYFARHSSADKQLCLETQQRGFIFVSLFLHNIYNICCILKYHHKQCDYYFCVKWHVKSVIQSAVGFLGTIWVDPVWYFNVYKIVLAWMPMETPCCFLWYIVYQNLSKYILNENVDWYGDESRLI